ncbi:parallel beta-helix repeat-containing protein [Catenovulum agarivorans DS-2]|uniref:Parallel beta-helix repeat-containing protein n=1 Tax=Catenovulum agarivorans DS-2 TaxID=1328313 RepID=W7QIA1_9ALTE|nr:hypothetical protein [Catenovulum agarivorans]EWH08652.1 parallel beta-helix repeat-containing protein [Catenovulum agarivorans DS-2]
MIGIGNPQANIHLCLQHRPPVEPYPTLQSVHYLQAGELTELVSQCSNNWRKVFNCYAKLLFELDALGFARWQDYRDDHLLQLGCQHSVLFAPAPLVFNPDPDCVYIIAGKTYAATLALPELEWLSPSFAINHTYKIIVSPYFDYRQLTNEKTLQLAGLIRQLC